MKKLILTTLSVILSLLATAQEHHDITVSMDGSGDFTSVQEAINSVPDFRKKARTTIFIKSGTYKEKIIVAPTKINLTLIGEDGTVLTYDDYASKLNRFGDEKSTSGSASVYIYAPDFIAENITFENSAGPVGQAVACFVAGDRAVFRNCRFLGCQDTLYTYGDPSRQYYEDCYIEGTVDFIFGKSTAVFNRCTIHSKGHGYLTAPATPEGMDYGYVFLDCNITADPGVTDVYLSRPWRPYAKAVFIRCKMDGHILPTGWDNWGRESNEATVYYAEFESTGKGANPAARVRYSHQLTDISRFSPEKVLAGDDNWSPFIGNNDNK